ncbi:MAG: spore gernimation protein [Sulfobacillus benefaciens]|uniref:Spore gernimation protein n=1 Tax=Sulfobacillus benefaciens TaxID=453960 RepID=A0A2T2XKD9_9FIRM|nr:MAG: spore gernimation protein [Sulfobacillus benefaciens]
MTRFKVWVKIATVFGLVFLLTGCWGNRPVNDRILVLCMGIDPAKSPNQFTVIFQSPTPSAVTNSSQGSSSASGGQSEVFAVKGTGQSLEAAFNQAQAKVSKDLYLGQLQLLVISNQLKPMLLKRAITSLQSIGTLDKTPYIVVANGSAFRMLQQTSPQAKFPSLYFISLFGCVSCQTDALGIRFWQYLVRIDTRGVDPYLPVALPFSQGYRVDRVALYRGYHYITMLDPIQTTTFGILQGLSHKVSVFLPKQQATVAFLTGPSHLTTQVINGQVRATFDIHLTAMLMGLDAHTETPQKISEISQTTSQIIAKRCVALVRQLQRQDVDPLGIGRMLSWQHPHTFSNFVHWHQEYPKVHVVVHCVVKITDVGTTK